MKKLSLGLFAAILLAGLTAVFVSPEKPVSSPREEAIKPVPNSIPSTRPEKDEVAPAVSPATRTRIPGSPAQSSLQIEGREQSMAARIGSSGIEMILPSTENDAEATVRLRLAATGRETLQKPKDAPIVDREAENDGLIALRHENGILETFETHRYGIEQKFHFDSPVGDRDEGQLRLVVDLDSTLLASQLSDRDAIWLADASGDARWYYSNLHVFDSEKRRLPSEMHLRPDAGIEITIDDREAVYPIVVDPLISPDTAFYYKPFPDGSVAWWTNQLEYYYKVERGVAVLEGPYWRFIVDAGAWPPRRLVEYGHHEDGRRDGQWLSYKEHQFPLESEAAYSQKLNAGVYNLSYGGMPEQGEYDENGRKQGPWKGGNRMDDDDILEQYALHTDEWFTDHFPYVGYEVSYDDGVPRGNLAIYLRGTLALDPILEMEGEIRDGKKEGLWSFYASSTSDPWWADSYLEIEAEYDEDLLDGSYTLYDPDGEKYFEGEFQNGVQHGRWKWYRSFYLGSERPFYIPDVDFEPPFTNYRSEANYRDGVFDGNYVGYTDDNRTSVFQRGTLRSGQKHGIWSTYRSSGMIDRQIGYHEGILDGTSKVWYPDSSQLDVVSNYRNGVLDGPWEHWAGDGRTLERGNYSNGLKVNTTWKKWRYFSDATVRDTYQYGSNLQTYTFNRVWEEEGTVLVAWRIENGIGGHAILQSTFEPSSPDSYYLKDGYGRLTAVPNINFHPAGAPYDSLQWSHNWNYCGDWTFHSTDPENPVQEREYEDCPDGGTGIQADFTWEITDPVNRTVQFTDTSTSTSGAVNSWEWVDVTTGSIFSTGSTPVYSFPTDGEHDVRLAVTSAGDGSSTMTRAVNLSGVSIRVAAEPDYDVPADGETPVSVTAVVTNSAGGPLQGISVEFSEPNGLGSFSPSSTTTGSNGEATTTFTPPENSELIGSASLLIATVDGKSVATQIYYARNSFYLSSLQPASGGTPVIPAHNAYPAYLEVIVLNNNGNRFEGEDITFRITDGAPGSLEGIGNGGSGQEITVTSDADGKAAVLYRFSGSLSGEPIDVPIEIESSGETVQTKVSVGMDLELDPVSSEGPFYTNTPYGLIFLVYDAAHPNLDLDDWRLDWPEAWAGRELGIKLDVDWINEPKGSFWQNLLPVQPQTVTSYHGNTSFSNGYAGRSRLFALGAPSQGQLPAMSFSGKGPHVLLATVELTDLSAGPLPADIDLGRGNNLRVFSAVVEDGPNDWLLDATCAFKATSQQQQLARDAITAIGDKIPAVKVIDTAVGWIDFTCDLFSGNWSAVVLKLGTEQINYLQGKVDSGELVLSESALKLLNAANFTQLSANYYDKLKSTSALPPADPAYGPPSVASEPLHSLEELNAFASFFLEAMARSGSFEGYDLLAAPHGTLTVDGSAVAVFDEGSSLTAGDLSDTMGFRSTDFTIWFFPMGSNASLVIDPTDSESLDVGIYRSGSGVPTWAWEHAVTGTAYATLAITGGIPASLEINDDAGSHSLAATQRVSIVTAAGENGRISPGEPLAAEYGDNVTATVTADSGCRIAMIQVDGEYIPVTDPYSQDIVWNPIESSHHVRASFFVDADDDGLPDPWEEQMTADSELTGLDPAADDDLDFLNNFEEYRAGTHPLKANEIPVFDFVGRVDLTDTGTNRMEEVTVTLSRDGSEVGSLQPDPVTGDFVFSGVTYGAFELEVSVADPIPGLRITPENRYFPSLTSSPPPAVVLITVPEKADPSATISASQGTYSDKTVITWTAIDEATGYEVFRNDSNTLAGAAYLGSSATTPYEDPEAGLNGIHYYFVRATVPLGYSAFSEGAAGWRGGLFPALFANALDNYSLTFTSEGAGTVVVENRAREMHDGFDALRMDQLADAPETVSLRSIVEGPGTLSFFWRLYSKNGVGDPDSFTFLVDDLEQAAIPTGEQWDYTRVSVPIPAGLHEIEWRYQKSHPNQGSLEATWVDQVHFVRDGYNGPASVTATEGTHADRVDVSWSTAPPPPEDGPDPYEILRSTTGRLEDAIAIATATDTSWSDPFVEANTTLYTYWIRTVGTTGSSQASPSADGWSGSFPRERWKTFQTAGDPVIDSHGIVYAAGNTEIHAFDRSGLLLRSSSVNALWGFQGPLLVGDNLLIASDAAHSRLIALNTVDLSLEWELVLPSAPVKPPVYSSTGDLIVVCEDSVIRAIDLDTRTERWSFDSACRADLVIGPWGRIYFGNPAGAFIALNPDGSQAWRTEVDKTAGGTFEAGACVGNDGTIYAGSWNQHFYGFHRDTGAIVLDIDMGELLSTGASTADDGTIYLPVSGRNEIRALHPATGATLWTATLPTLTNRVPSVAANGEVIVGGSDGILYALDPVDGTVAWSHSCDPAYGLTSAALDADGTIFVGSPNALCAVRGQTGGLAALSAWPKRAHDAANSGNSGWSGPKLWSEWQDAWLYGVDEALRAPSADPDFDGLSNLWEYLFGTRPNDTSSYDCISGQLLSSGGYKYLTLTIPIDPGAVSVRVGAEYSTNLIDWGETGVEDLTENGDRIFGHRIEAGEMRGFLRGWAELDPQ